MAVRTMSPLSVACPGRFRLDPLETFLRSLTLAVLVSIKSSGDMFNPGLYIGGKSKKKGEEEEVAAVHNPFVPPPSVTDRPRRCSSSPSATLEIGKEDEVSGNIGSGSMFASVCSWSVWIVGKAVNNFLKKMGISLHFHP
ncbi:uncharacterized protein LOC127148936 [Cucumis melo]|uniref:Uncharacterized protein LOC127148936 n=1 Tax=Cucumis melo TaxID=3656 RepID=A0ABM3KNH3_CUCME|nr:uncharacterized protein LOC127148936 [Cucumis melo]